MITLFPKLVVFKLNWISLLHCCSKVKQANCIEKAHFMHTGSFGVLYETKNPNTEQVNKCTFLNLKGKVQLKTTWGHNKKIFI